MYKQITVTVQVPSGKYCNLCNYKGTFGTGENKRPTCKLGLGKPQKDGYNINKSIECLNLCKEKENKNVK